MMLEQGLLQIHPKFDKLIVSLRTAIEEEGNLDKELTSYDDIFDAFRLARKYGFDKPRRRMYNFIETL